jgi:hypothetical protein
LWDGTELAKIYGNSTIIAARANLILADPSVYGDHSDTLKLWALGPVDPATGLRVTRAYTLDQLGLTSLSLNGSSSNSGGNVVGLANTTTTALSGLTSFSNTTTLHLTSGDVGAVASTNGVSYGLVAKQIGTGTNWPITIYADDLAGANNGYSIGNGHIAGGSGGPYPVAFFRPTTPGYSMPFDLMPNGGNADVWMDFARTTSTPTKAANSNYLDVRQRSFLNGNYGEITTDAWGLGRVPGDLRLQTRGSGTTFGGHLHRHTDRAEPPRRDRALFQLQRPGVPVRCLRAVPHGDQRQRVPHQVRKHGRILFAFKDSGSTTIPLNIVGNPINLTGPNVTLSFDNNWINRTPQQFRPGDRREPRRQRRGYCGAALGVQ